jgi:hypothetical protein
MFAWRIRVLVRNRFESLKKTAEGVSRGRAQILELDLNLLSVGYALFIKLPS